MKARIEGNEWELEGTPIELAVFIKGYGKIETATPYFKPKADIGKLSPKRKLGRPKGRKTRKGGRKTRKGGSKNKHWSRKELELLTLAIKRGDSKAKIAKELGRTKPAVNSKMWVFKNGKSQQ